MSQATLMEQSTLGEGVKCGVHPRQSPTPPSAVQTSRWVAVGDRHVRVFSSQLFSSGRLGRWTVKLRKTPTQARHAMPPARVRAISRKCALFEQQSKHHHRNRTLLTHPFADVTLINHVKIDFPTAWYTCVKNQSDLSKQDCKNSVVSSSWDDVRKRSRGAFGR